MYGVKRKIFIIRHHILDTVYISAIGKKSQNLQETLSMYSSVLFTVHSLQASCIKLMLMQDQHFAAASH